MPSERMAEVCSGDDVHLLSVRIDRLMRWWQKLQLMMRGSRRRREARSVGGSPPAFYAPSHACPSSPMLPGVWSA